MSRTAATPVRVPPAAAGARQAPVPAAPAPAAVLAEPVPVVHVTDVTDEHSGRDQPSPAAWLAPQRRRRALARTSSIARRTGTATRRTCRATGQPDAQPDAAGHPRG